MVPRARGGRREQVSSSHPLASTSLHSTQANNAIQKCNYLLNKWQNGIFALFPHFSFSKSAFCLCVCWGSMFAGVYVGVETR